MRPPRKKSFLQRYIKTRNSPLPSDWALLVLLQLVWITRVAAVVFLAWELITGRFLETAALAWKIAFLAVFAAINLVGLIYVRSDRPDQPAWVRRERWLRGIKLRLILHGLTIALIAFVVTWDLGAHSWVTGILSSLAAAAFYAMLGAGAFLLGSKPGWEQKGS